MPRGAAGSMPVVGQCRSTARITTLSETVLPRSDLVQVVRVCPAFLTCPLSNLSLQPTITTLVVMFIGPCIILIVE